MHYIKKGINEAYIKLIQNIYANGTSVVRLHKDTEKKNAKEVRQGDTYSPKLFTACLKGIFRKFSWESNIDDIGDKYRWRTSYPPQICR